MMHFLQFAVVVGLTSVAVNALPLAGRQISELAYLLTGYDGQKIASCDLSNAIMPQSNGDNLAPPDAGLALVRVVLGRGTQNYTCTDSTDQSIPVANGAVATLYDASCLAQKNPELLHSLPDAIVNIPRDVVQKALGIVSKMARQDILIGHHYFAPNNTVPVFDFREKKQKYLLAGKRDQGVPAVTTASKGGMGQGYGAVDWLRIKAIPSMSVDYKLGYRIQTAGGKPPNTCKGLSKEFAIEYATEYWVYA